jgi:hypothetical protein
MTTHYVPAFTRPGPGPTWETVCGVFTTEHSTQPTCQQCQEYLEADPETEPVYWTCEVCDEPAGDGNTLCPVHRLEANLDDFHPFRSEGDK